MFSDTADGSGIRAIKTVAVLKKWGDEQDPARDAPREVIERASWATLDGTPVTDPAAIARLEASLARTGQEQG